jgi:hypothetical protein
MVDISGHVFLFLLCMRLKFKTVCFRSVNVQGKSKIVPVLNEVLRYEDISIVLLSTTLWRRIG